jgi:hypothetical protein
VSARATAAVLALATCLATLALVVAAPAAALAQPMPPVPPLPGRPLGALDLAPRSSVGVRVEAGVALGLDEPVMVLAGQIEADIALGPYLKAFATYPIVVGHAYGDATVGVGNLRAGALLAADVGPAWRLGAGAALGYGASADGHVGFLQHFDLAAFEQGKPVVQAFVGARHGDATDDSFVQITLDHAHYLDTELPGARVGGGWRQGGLWLLAQVRAAEDFEGSDAEATLLALDLGLRGRFVGRVAETWCLLVGIAHFDGVTSPSAGFEIRTW